MLMNNREAYYDGKQAFKAGVSPLANPFTPAPPGNPIWAALWRAGWHSAKRRKKT